MIQSCKIHATRFLQSCFLFMFFLLFSKNITCSIAAALLFVYFSLVGLCISTFNERDGQRGYKVDLNLSLYST